MAYLYINKSVGISNVLQSNGLLVTTLLSHACKEMIVNAWGSVKFNVLFFHGKCYYLL